MLQKFRDGPVASGEMKPTSANFDMAEERIRRVTNLSRLKRRQQMKEFRISFSNHGSGISISGAVLFTHDR